MNKIILQKSLLFLLIFFIAFAGCKEEEPFPKIEKPEEVKPPVQDTTPDPVLKISSFKFNKSLNPALTEDIKGIIEDDKITVLLPEPAVDLDLNLIPSFIGVYKSVEVAGVIQTSGVTSHDFSQVITYKLTSSKGKVKTYEVTVKIFTGIPIVRIETENGQAITSKEDYVNGTITISKTPQFGESFQGTMRIKGRGNATWTAYPKKPYRIKLDSKSKILGMPSDKDWVLLAEYCDKSLLRTTYAFELSKLMGFPWTPRGYHVEVFLNGSYNGTYFLGEHVKVATNRANIAEDGYLIENDNYYNSEPIWFTTNRGLNYTFKYPDTDNMVKDDDNYKFIQNYMNEFETVLFSDYFADPNTGLRKYIDVESFAKWYLLQETLGNAEPNSYYVLESRTRKLKMYPVWDFEWSMGLAYKENNTWNLPPATSPVAHLYHRDSYFKRLLEDPYFVSIVKQEWIKVKGHLPTLTTIISEKSENIRHSQIKNFERWDILGKYISVGLVKFNTWEEEVDYAKEFLDAHAKWLDNEISNW